MSSVQLNLLPEVKLEYIKAKQQKRVVALAAIAVSAASVLLMALLLFDVKVWQHHTMTNLTNNISTTTKKLQSDSELNKVLTVQNQLNSLPGLEQQKPVSSRLFTYMEQLTPSNVNITSLDVDFTADTITENISTKSLQTVNDYIDIIKYTAYKTPDDTTAPTCDPSKTTDQCAFNSVVMSDFGLGDPTTGGTGGEAFATLTYSFDPDIFDATKAVTLVVPQGSVSPTTNIDSLFINDPNAKAKTTGTGTQ